MMVCPRAPFRSLLLSIVLAFVVPEPASAQAGGPTGWCTDHSGRNFRCGTAAPAPPAPHNPAPATPRRFSKVQKDQLSRHIVAMDAAFGGDDAATAADAAQRALRIDPDNARARRGLGLAMEHLGDAARARGDLASAFSYYARGIKAETTVQRREKYRTLLSRAERRPSCQVCGQALYSDTWYGVDRSRLFLTYSGEALANYSNCMEQVRGGCYHTWGTRLYSAIATCRQKFPKESPLRACVRTTLTGAANAPR